MQGKYTSLSNCSASCKADCNNYGVYNSSSTIYSKDGTLLKDNCGLYWETGGSDFGNVIIGPDYTYIYNLLNKPIAVSTTPIQNLPFTIVYSGITDNSEINLIKDEIKNLPEVVAYSIEKTDRGISIVFSKNYPISPIGDIKCESNQTTQKCFDCDNSLGIEAFQVGGYSYQIKNDTKENILNPKIIQD